MRTLITMITWNRLKLTRETLRTFEHFNGKKDILIVDNGSTDRTVKHLRKRRGYEVIESKKNLGVFLATRIAWLEARNRGYDFILNLQNDFPSIRPVPYEDIEKYLDENSNVGFVQLNDKGRLCYPKKNGKYRIKIKPRKKNLVTGKSIKYKGWMICGSTKFAKGNYHFSFNPNFFRTELVPILVDKVIKPRERQIMEQFAKTKLKCAKLHHRCFETVIRKRENTRKWKR